MHVRRSHGLSNSYFSAHYFKCTRDNFAMPNEMKYFLMQTAATAACFEREMNCSNNTTTTTTTKKNSWALLARASSSRWIVITKYDIYIKWPSNMSTSCCKFFFLPILSNTNCAPYFSPSCLTTTSFLALNTTSYSPSMSWITLTQQSL